MRLLVIEKKNFARDDSWFDKIISNAQGKTNDCYLGKIGKRSKVLNLAITTSELSIEHDEESDDLKFENEDGIVSNNHQIVQQWNCNTFQ